MKLSANDKNISYIVKRFKRRLERLFVYRLFRSSEWSLRKQLKWYGAKFPPKAPGDIWVDWINSTLKTSRQVEAALDQVRYCGLPPRKDTPKNWDSLIALGLVLERCSLNARILDAGSQYSFILPWLYIYGYRNLWGIDIIYEKPLRNGPIRYEKADLMQTHFPDSSFDIITCLSVIEHGVILDEYLREMSRLLRPGGLLITSTDYWEDPIHTGKQIAFGVPVKIFTRKEIIGLIAASESYGLMSIQPIDLECQDKVVRWEEYNLDYTFINFILEKSV